MDFSWVKTQKELVNYLYDKEDKQIELIQLLKNSIEFVRENNELKRFEDEDNTGKIELTEIDPFTFFSLIYHYYTDKVKILQKIAEKINISKPFGEFNDFGIYEPKDWFFPFKKERSNEISNLWSFYRNVVNNSITDEIFNEILKQKSINLLKLTQAISYIKPDVYFPINNNSKRYLNEFLQINPNFNTFSEYLEIIKNIQDKTSKTMFVVSYDAIIWKNSLDNLITFSEFPVDCQYFRFIGSGNHGIRKITSIEKNNQNEIKKVNYINIQNQNEGRKRRKGFAKNILPLNKENAILELQSLLENEPDNVYYKNELAILMGNKLNILQKIYDDAIKNNRRNFNERFNFYKKCIEEYKENALSNYWDEIIFERLVKSTTKNGISSLKQNNFTWEEYSKIKENWFEIQPIIKKIALKNSIDTIDYDNITAFFRKFTTVNKVAASNRIIAAFLPNFVTTVIKIDTFKNLILKCKSNINDYPEIEDNWLNDNINFINYCNSNVNFKEPWHSSFWGWYLKEYFENNSNLEENKMNNYTQLLKNNHQIILTGAPGTGKTYLAKKIAKELNAVTEFVQFHPSFDYTDFVEGLRPIYDAENNQLGFELRNGIFKEFCIKALKSYKRNEVDNFEDVWELLLEFVRNNFANNQLTKIGSWDYCLSSKDSLKYSSLNTPSQYNFTITKKNVYDAYKNLKARPSGAFQKDMEDVVLFMKENFQLKDYQKGEINQDSSQNYVFIIDEINRAEISKVFGELFFSLDPSYRGENGKVKTQYANLQTDKTRFSDLEEGYFFVPKNVYIIGTMNDIDRSVESFDFAMRRRFTWIEILAKERTDMFDDEIPDYKEDATKKMNAINEVIDKIDGLNSSYHVGPAYFLKLKNYNGDFELLWKYHIQPLLHEYLRGLPNAKNDIITIKTAYDA